MKDKKIKLRYKLLNFDITPVACQSPEKYVELLKKILDDKIHKTTFHEKRTELKYLEVQDRYVYGTLINSTILSNGKWFDDDKEGMVDFEVDKKLHPNTQVWRFCFVPSTHRLALYLDNKASLGQVKKYFEEAFKDVVDRDKGEEVHVSIVSSEDAIDAILNAKHLTSLEMEVTYTNNDNNEEWEEADQQLKDSKITKVKTKLSGTPQQPISLKSGTFFHSLLHLCKDYGKAIAVGKFDGKRKKISTERYPDEIRTSYIDGQSREEIVTDEVIKRYGDKD